MEENYNFLKELNLLSNMVGATPLNKFKKIPHLRPMLSLSNAFNLEDMKDFQKKINNYLNFEDKNFELFFRAKNRWNICIINL